MNKTHDHLIAPHSIITIEKVPQFKKKNETKNTIIELLGK